MKTEMKVHEYIVSLYKENPDVKILEYNRPNESVEKGLLGEGFDNYLGLPGKVAVMKGGKTIEYKYDKSILAKNNADIIILHQTNFIELKNSLNSPAELIIYDPASPLDNFSFFPLLVYKLARKKKWKFQPTVLLDEHQKKRACIVFKRKYEKEKAVRHYLSPDVALEDFFSDLNGRGLNYTVLRWHDKLPFSDLSEDIDLLISDNDLSAVQEIMNKRIGIIPFDLYSTGGTPGSDFKNMAYYPPYLAERILQNRELWEGKFFIPSKKDYFLSLMYHAVYHKGEKSGIPVDEREMPDSEIADHEYLQILQRLAAENDVELDELNLSYFHLLLEKEGWAPATDTIRKLSDGQESWLQSVIRPSENDFEKDGEIMVFVVREWAYNRGLTGFFIDWFEKRGLNLTGRIVLDEAKKKEAAKKLRGGNWGRGPFPTSGGVPAVLLVFYDYHPTQLDAKLKNKYPYVSNPLYLLKEDLRAEINSVLAPDEKVNPIHSSDDEIEALEYIEAVSPEFLEELKRIITDWDERYRTKETVLKDLSENRRRAKVELIEYQGENAVKKTYRAGNDRFLEREKYVYGELSKECVYIPKLLASGENYIIIPYLKTIRNSKNIHIKRHMLKSYKKEIWEICEFFYRKGYAVIDFHPGNLLITDEGLKLIDFEFLYQYEKLPASSLESFDLMGFPEDFDQDRPLGIKGEYIRKHWKKILF